MWTLFVVLRLPITYLPACVKEVGEPAHPQALFAQATMEALHMTVLTHCQLHRHRSVQEDVSELLIRFIHG